MRLKNLQIFDPICCPGYQPCAFLLSQDHLFHTGLGQFLRQLLTLNCPDLPVPQSQSLYKSKFVSKLLHLTNFSLPILHLQIGSQENLAIKHIPNYHHNSGTEVRQFETHSKSHIDLPINL